MTETNTTKTRPGALILFFACLIVIAHFAYPPKRQNISERTKIILLDFETDSELDHLKWHCGTIYQRVNKHFTSGESSLKVEMHPHAEWPGFITLIETNLVPYSQLKIDIFNPSDTDATLLYRIDDRRNQPPYGDRANGREIAPPGQSTISFKLEDLKTSGTKRPLRKEKIKALYLFIHRPSEKVTLYFDNMRVN